MEVQHRSLDWWVLSLGNPSSMEEGICYRENLSADMRILDLAGPEAPLYACAIFANPRLPSSGSEMLHSFAPGLLPGAKEKAVCLNYTILGAM